MVGLRDRRASPAPCWPIAESYRSATGQRRSVGRGRSPCGRDPKQVCQRVTKAIIVLGPLHMEECQPLSPAGSSICWSLPRTSMTGIQPPGAAGASSAFHIAPQWCLTTAAVTDASLASKVRSRGRPPSSVSFATTGEAGAPQGWRHLDARQGRHETGAHRPLTGGSRRHPKRQGSAPASRPRPRTVQTSRWRASVGYGEAGGCPGRAAVTTWSAVGVRGMA